MQLTIDSDTTLDAALRLVGAFYGVEISVAKATAASDGGLTDDRPAPARGGRGRSSGSRRAAGAGSRRGGRRAGASARPRARKAAAAGGSSTAAIRSWAQANGLVVNSRGRIPATVVDAYRAAGN